MFVAPSTSRDRRPSPCLEMKLHQLAELTKLDRVLKPSHECSSTARNKLKVKDATEAKHCDETLHKNYVKIMTLKFNIQLENWEAFKKKVTSTLKKHNIEKWSKKSRRHLCKISRERSSFVLNFV